MINQKKVAIVILNWNGKKLLRQYLPSVVEHSRDEDVKIVVADNGSTDNSIDFVRENFPSVTVLCLNENYGFAKGYNVALQKVDADYFILLNSDVEVTERWIEPSIERMEANPKIAAIQPKVLSYQHKGQFEYAGAAGGFIDKFGYPFCRGRILNVNEQDEGQYDRPSPIFWATGACLFIRAGLFKMVGGFDEDFWAHMEEIDLCWRLKNRGFAVWYEPGSVVYHLGGGTLSYDNPKKIYLNFRNNLFMLFKNLPKGKAFFPFFVRMVLDGVAAIKFLVNLNLKAFWAVCKAHAVFYKNFSRFNRKRKLLQPVMSKPSHNEVFQSSIMWKFFIQKIRKFSELDFDPED
ncbi:MAG: glycosyltransferase family 2 protein [Chlorobi bacterium]|nr:glycosyltransferase family 2 protein [Chlorobiota bacterium]